MIVNPLLIMLSIKASIIITLLVSIFFFSSSFITKVRPPSHIRREKVVGISKTFKNGLKVNSFKPGPFMIKILKVLAFLSLISLTISLYSEFQRIKVTFSL